MMDQGRSRSVLMVAYHFPPFTGSSGVQRTLKFCRYLREYGWKPIVLTVEPRAYEKVDSRALNEVPEDVPVLRSYCLDTARHLSVAGRYPGLLALPDRWTTWFPAGVWQGSRAIRRWRPDVIWSTYPVATAHLIAGALALSYNVPWVADFRDWMTDGDYPDGKLKRSIYRRIEKFALSRSDAAVFTTQGSFDLYKDRYEHLASTRWCVLPNGYDEADFEETVSRPEGSGNGIVLLHSGYLYPRDRSPRALFEALAALKRDRFLRGTRLRIRFRAPGDEGYLLTEAMRFGVSDLVEVRPAIPHREAVREMQDVEALLLIQGPRFKRQVPAKAYEYLRSGRPILTMSAMDSETSRFARLSGQTYCADMAAADDIAWQLRRLVLDIEAGRVVNVGHTAMSQYERRNQAGHLARILSSVATAGAFASQDERPGLRPAGRSFNQG